MASPSAQTPARGMSSRVLTMKFMQRAAAASASAPSSPSARRTRNASAAGLDGDGEPTAKRRRTMEHEAVSNALRELEAKRRAAFQRHAIDAADAEWTLDLPFELLGKQAATPQDDGPKIEYVGFGEIDGSGIDVSRNRDFQNGRMRTANFKGKDNDKQQAGNSGKAGEDEDSGAGSESDPDSGRGRDSGHRDLPRRESGFYKAPLDKSNQDRQSTKKTKKTNITSITSISDGGPTPRRAAYGRENQGRTQGRMQGRLPDKSRR